MKYETVAKMILQCMGERKKKQLTIASLSIVGAVSFGQLYVGVRIWMNICS